MKTKKTAPFSEMNMVPYLDVMLVLLIIFMVVTPTLQMGLPIALPRANTSEVRASKDAPSVLTMDAKGKLSLSKGEEKPLEISSDKGFLEWFRAHNVSKDAPVFIKADRTLVWEEVMRAMIRLQKIGWHKVTLLTEPEQA